MKSYNTVHHVDVAACAGQRLDLALILDQSTSIGNQDWQNVVAFLTKVTNSLEVSTTQVRIAVATFNQAASVIFKLDRYSSRQEVIDAITNIAYNGGDTNIASGLRVTWRDIFGQSGDRPDVNNVAILFTDGVANTEANAIPAEAESLKKVANVVSVGVTTGVDQDQLKRIASKPEWFLFARTFDELVGQSSVIASIACTAVEEVGMSIILCISSNAFKFLFLIVCFRIF